MKTTVPAFFAILSLLLSSACQRSDQETARERGERFKAKAEAAARKLERDGKELAAKASEKARELRADSNSEGGDSPKEKLKRGAAELHREGKEAGTKLSQMGQSAKVKYNLSTVLGIGAVSNIEVDSNGSTVTLRGSVPSADGRAEAERVALSTSGVTKVVNELRVGR